MFLIALRSFNFFLTLTDFVCVGHWRKGVAFGRLFSGNPRTYLPNAVLLQGATQIALEPDFFVVVSFAHHRKTRGTVRAEVGRADRLVMSVV